MKTRSGVKIKSPKLVVVSQQKTPTKKKGKQDGKIVEKANLAKSSPVKPTNQNKNKLEKKEEEEEEDSHSLNSSGSELEEDKEEELEEESEEESEEEETEEGPKGFVVDLEPTKEEEEDSESEEEEKKEEKKEESSSSEEEEEEYQKVEEPSGPSLKYSKDKEKLLEQFIFGNDLDTGEGTTALQDDDSSDDSSDDSADDEEKAADKKDADKADSKIPEDKLQGWGDNFARAKKRKAVWSDEDDEETLVKDVAATFSKAKGKHGRKEESTEKYSKALKKKFLSIVGAPAWADLTKNQKKKKKNREDQDDDSDEEFFRETTDMLETGRQESLQKGYLEFRKLKDLNASTHAEGTVIRATEFHPNATVALVAGLNGTASLFQVDGRLNPRMQTVNFQDFPIKTAHFSADGNEFLVGSQHFPHFYSYDMLAGKSTKVTVSKKHFGFQSMQNFKVSPAGDYVVFQGRFGDVHFLKAGSKERAFSLKMNEDCTAFDFSPDGSQLYSHGAGGEVYVWDLRARDCVRRFVDEGCIRGTSLAVSANGRYLATGSDSGVVNLYDKREVVDGGAGGMNPKPMKTFLNLTTTVEGLKFNPSSEILAFGSEMKENGIKLAHIPSLTVFSNFPSWNFNLKRVNCFDFSLNGGYLAVGNNRGAANLYRLKHYGSY